MSTFKRRIGALEDSMLPSFITLFMPDGSTERIHERDLPQSFIDVLRGRKTPVLKKIIDSVSSDEKDRMIELIKAIAAGPVP